MGDCHLCSSLGCCPVHSITSSFCTEHLPAAHLAPADPVESWLKISDGQLWQWVIQPGVGLVGSSCPEVESLGQDMGVINL